LTDINLLIAIDDTLVLIENQLEGSDHTHLGQIMTYLAGLEAHTIVWIAADFREPHLSRWPQLNSTSRWNLRGYSPVLEVLPKNPEANNSVHVLIYPEVAKREHQ
jgi:hypothetical protein